jgi:glucuronokinase
LTELVASAIRERKFGKIPALLNRNFDLRCEVCSDAISSKNMQMVKVARSCGASAKFTGSGGAIIGTYEDEKMFEAMKAAFRESRVELLKPSIVRSGN